MSVLMLGADYYGTLSAVRAYGEARVPVRLADSNPRGRAMASRFVKERLVSPPWSEVEELVRFLEHQGDPNAKQVLYPTNDHLAWILAAHAPRLVHAYHLHQPSADVVLGLLDKQRLHEDCKHVGIDVPPTWYAAHDGEIDRVAREVSYPVLLKPRTQVLLDSGIKGYTADDAAGLRRELERWQREVRFHDLVVKKTPDIGRPMFQAYLTAAETAIYSVSGYITAGGHAVLRGAQKVLQRPRKVGIGLCFEHREVEPEIQRKLVALCRHVGYFGAFESEFIVDGDQRLLIDFNPRFYSQMAFDVARGLPLPMLVYHAARGEDGEVARLLDRAEAWRPEGPEGYCHRLILELVLGLQGASGKMPRAERAHWRAWVKSREPWLTDAVRHADDPMPAWVDARQWAQHFTRHPRSFVRQFVLNQTF